MRKRIQRKLRSRTGASITFALLLFLVCAVLCSVIIAASTAASGRMSRIAETDQRYYAVTSAAELLTDLIEGKTVTIADRTVTTSTTTYTGGHSSTSSETSEPSIYIIRDKKPGEIDDDAYDEGNLLDEVIDEAIDSIPVYAAIHYCSDETPLAGRTLALSWEEHDALAVTIEEDLDALGNIRLTIYNKYNSDGDDSTQGDRYTLVLRFGADRSETASTKTDSVSSEVTGADTYTVTTQKTETKFTTMTWNLIGIEPPGEA